MLERIKELDSAIADFRKRHAEIGTEIDKRVRERTALFESLTPEEKAQITPPVAEPQPAGAAPAAPVESSDNTAQS